MLAAAPASALLSGGALVPEDVEEAREWQGAAREAPMEEDRAAAREAAWGAARKEDILSLAAADDEEEMERQSPRCRGCRPSRDSCRRPRCRACRVCANFPV